VSTTDDSYWTAVIAPMAPDFSKRSVTMITSPVRRSCFEVVELDVPPV